MAPEGSPQKLEAREVGLRLTAVALSGGHMSDRMWKKAFRALHPEVVCHLSERDIDTMIAMVRRDLSRRR